MLTDTLNTDANLSTATTATTVGTLVAPDAAGTYTGVVYQDTNFNSSVDPGEPSSYVSITTAGAPASATLTPATDTEAAGAAGEFTVTLKDASGNTTQAAVGEFFSISADPAGATANATIAGAGLTSITNPGTNLGAASTAVIPFTALGDGVEAFTVAGSAAGDTVAIAVASSGALRAQGVASSLTATLTTVGASSAVGTATAITNVRLAATTTGAVTAAETVLGVNPYLADPSLATVTFEINGLDANKSIAFDITATDNGANDTFDTAANVTVNINGVDADTAYASGTDLTAVADANGKVVVVWTTVGTFTAADSDLITLDVNGDSANAAATKRQTNATVTWVTPRFALALTAPTTTTLLVTKTSTVTFSGTLKDQFSNPLQGAVLNLVGVQTGTAVAANLTASTTSAADGSWSLTMAAPAATTTSVSATVTAVRTGATFIAAVATGQNPSVAYTINYTATGDATTLTHVASPAQTLATDGVTIATIPATITPHDGVVTITAAAGLSDASYTISTAATAALATDTNTGLDEYFTIVPTSTPAAEVTFTSDDSVWFSAATANVAAVTASSSVFNKTGKFASGSTVKIWSTKAGRHTVTMSVGATTKTQDFWTSADATSGRNIAVAVPASVKQGEIGRVTITVTDNWGNPVKGVAAATITAAVTGQGTLGGGKITDTFGATDSAGQAVLAFQAGNADGDLTFTITAASVNYQFSSLAGRAGYVAAHTTDGTLTGLTKSVISAAQKTTVSGSAAAAASNPEVTAVKADVKAVS
ncbi:MAG: hypothetical protein EBU84_14740, partial [Actinobacteria bacterium]|nr:hypothetical protein [Actinomycetota bacterium]